MTRIRDFCSPFLENSLKAMDRHLPNDYPLREIELLRREPGKSLSSDVTTDKPSYAKNSLISRDLSSSSPTSSMRTKCNGARGDCEGGLSVESSNFTEPLHPDTYEGASNGSRLHFPDVRSRNDGEANSCDGKGEAKKERENRKRKRRISTNSVSRKRRYFSQAGPHRPMLKTVPSIVFEFSTFQ